MFHMKAIDLKLKPYKILIISLKNIFFIQFEGKLWWKPSTRKQGIVSFEVTLEVGGYMYPGSDLQTRIGGSDFGLKQIGEIFYKRQKDKL